MKGRAATAEEREWLDLVAQSPCLICKHFHDAPDSPAEIHHLDGKTVEGAHKRTIALCARHHRYADTAYPKRWISRHRDGKHAFEERYIPEEALLALQALENHKIREATV